MTDNTKILVRRAREQDIAAVVEIDSEAFSTYGTAETPETFQRWLTAFPDGFIILIADNEIAAYGCSEKWLTERDPSLEEKPLATHQMDGRILYIPSMAVKMKYRGKGYGLLVLDKLIEIAHREGCRKIVVETTDAQGLYRKRSFTTVQTRTEGGISLDVMSLDIESYGSKA
jgi:ribosomal protein S18 acetylase RimI-like enzyme